MRGTAPTNSLEGLSRGELLSLLDFTSRCMTARSAADFGALSQLLKNILPMSFLVAGIARIGPDGVAVSSATTIQDYRHPRLVGGKERDPAPLDPVCVLALRRRKPLYWSQARLDSDEEASAFLRRAESHGMAQGLSYVFLPQGEITGAFLSCSGPDLTPGGRYAAHAEYVLPNFGYAHIACMGNGPGEALSDRLTTRELEVLEWAMTGLTNTGIALKISVAARTVKFHIANAIRKLGAENRCHAISLAIAHGILKFPARGGCRPERG